MDAFFLPVAVILLVEQVLHKKEEAHCSGDEDQLTVDTLEDEHCGGVGVSETINFLIQECSLSIRNVTLIIFITDTRGIKVSEHQRTDAWLGGTFIHQLLT